MPERTQRLKGLDLSDNRKLMDYFVMGEMKEKTANQSTDLQAPENLLVFRERKSKQAKNLPFIWISS